MAEDNGLYSFGCEDGCEHFYCYETGTSIYGPDVVEGCGHPKAGQCPGAGQTACPRRLMSAKELVEELFESQEKANRLAWDLRAVIENAESCYKQQVAGHPYQNDPFPDLGALLKALRYKIDMNEHGEELCEKCCTMHIVGKPHECKGRGGQ